MKKIIYFVVLLLLPICVFAKTPNKEETTKFIENITNVQVDDGIKIYNVSVDDNEIVLNINDNGIITEKRIAYQYNKNELVFKGGVYQNNNNVLKEVETNDYAFYLYSILENASSTPYEIDNYYNRNNIEEKIKKLSEDTKTYTDTSKTFGLTLSKELIENVEYVNISYHYYFDGDNPVMLREEETDELKNPQTGNYTVMITVMLMAVIGIGLYTSIDSK